MTEKTHLFRFNPHKLLAKVGDEKHVFRVGYTGSKGDGPWERKAYLLKSGFSSKRKCHLCSGNEA